jgi:SagB-type dehydrogenase family enzyme
MRLPSAAPSMPLGEALRVRASGLAAGAVPAGRLATILDAAYGCRPGDAGLRRPVPSAGALYPLELYAVVRAVADVAAGVYHFDPYDHRLERLGAGDPSSRLADALFEPALAELTGCALVVTAVFPRTRFKYGQRGYRFALLEAGHLGQNVLLVAAAVGLSALPYGGFYDRRTDALVGADGLDECTVAVLLIGGPR